MVDVLIGLQWGDEGKGKIVDYLASAYGVVARFQGGPNAGHTLYVHGKKLVLHTVPSGILHTGTKNLIGSGVVIDPTTLQKELAEVAVYKPDYHNYLYISRKAHLILPSHRALDAASEAAKGKDKIGSTLKGIGPAYMDKTGRNGLRVGDILLPDFKERYNVLKEKHKRMLASFEQVTDWELQEDAFMEAVEQMRQLHIVNGEYWINDQLTDGAKVLAEGAQGSMLDIDFGTYPYVTSSNTVSAGVCNGLGVAPHKIAEVYGVTKAYCTRVGSGPFPTELNDEVGEQLRKAGNEFGATTGRPRRCGWIDLVALRYAIMLSGVTNLIITKADVLDAFSELKAAWAYSCNGEHTEEFPFDAENTTLVPVYRSFQGWEKPIAGITKYDDLDTSFRTYVSFLEDYLKVPVGLISSGSGREEIIEINQKKM